MTNDNKVSFLKYRNDKGQMLVVYTKHEDGLHLGVSFCNPKDFNLPRAVRTARGTGYALSRLKKPFMVLPNTFKAVSEDKKQAHQEFRHYVFSFVSENVALESTVRYRGHKNKEGAFITWFVPFVEKELDKIGGNSDGQH